MPFDPAHPKLRVEVGAADGDFTPSELSVVLAYLDRFSSPFEEIDEAVAKFFAVVSAGVEGLPVPETCTGYYDRYGLIAHDGDSCPVHELDEALAAGG